MTEQFILEGFFHKNVSIEFTGENTTSDSGLILFKPIVDSLNIVNSINKILHDPRDQDSIKHSMTEMLSQRLYQIIGGYNDINDSDYLRKDTMFKTICKGDPEEDDLSSSPTLCRLENNITFAEVIKLIELQVELYLKRNKKRFKKQLKKNGFINICLDLDPTNVTTYGEQQLSLFNGYYKEKCYLPLVIADGRNSDLVCGMLRPGTKYATFLLPSILKRIFSILEKEYSLVHYHIKADSGFQSEIFFSFLENKKNLTYEIALSTNNNLEKANKHFYEDGKIYFSEEDKVLKIYNEFGYKAKSWSKFRRVVYKVEINTHGHDVRYVVTNDVESSVEAVISSYHYRAEMENRIKEIKSQSGANKLSCKSFRANSFRFCMSCFSFIAYQEFKKRLEGTSFGNCYVQTIREKLIKVAGIITVTTRRIVIRLSKYYPYQKIWGQLVYS